MTPEPWRIRPTGERQPIPGDQVGAGFLVDVYRWTCLHCWHASQLDQTRPEAEKSAGRHYRDEHDPAFRRREPADVAALHAQGYNVVGWDPLDTA